MVHGEIAFVQQILVRTVWQVLAVFLHLRAISSVGLERLPYKQEVNGSTPLSPTRDTEKYSLMIRAVYRLFRRFQLGSSVSVDSHVQ